MMEYKRLTKKDEVGNWQVWEDDYSHSFEALQVALERLAELEDKIEQGTLKEIPEGAVVLTNEKLELGKYKDEVQVMCMTRQVYDAMLAQARKATAEKFALKLADYFVEHCGGRLSISLTLQEWYKMIDEIANAVKGVQNGD